MNDVPAVVPRPPPPKVGRKRSRQLRRWIALDGLIGVGIGHLDFLQSGKNLFLPVPQGSAQGMLDFVALPVIVVVALGFHELTRCVDATPYRGKRKRLSASLRGSSDPGILSAASPGTRAGDPAMWHGRPPILHVNH